MTSPTKILLSVSEPWVRGAVTCLLVCAVGCGVPSATVRRVDTRLARYSKSAHTAYAEGYLDEAVGGYRKALHRAWAMDDPNESGTAAYNLAACYASLSMTDRSKQWLLDARVEMCRANVSPVNVWILESKIARDDDRPAEAERYLHLASCSGTNCDQDGGPCFCGPRDPCGDGCLTKIPCVGKKIAAKRSTKECHDTSRAQIALGRARLAAKQYELAKANSLFQRACRLVGDQCNHDIQSELQNTAAHIHLARGEFLKAAKHFDNDAYHLRLAGNYREIPGALRMSAAAYQQAGYVALAASRQGRVARILLGRGDVPGAWQALQKASEMAVHEGEGDVSTTIRLTLVAQEIELVLSSDIETTSEVSSTPSGMILTEP